MEDSRISRYNMFEYTVTFFNSSTVVTQESRIRTLKFRSSCIDAKPLADTAVRLAKNHNWMWTSFLVMDTNNKNVALRVARKARVNTLAEAINNSMNR